MSESMLKLISHPLCPFVQRAAIVLLEKGTAFERIQVDLAAKPDWFLALSPTGKVPLLLVGKPDGSEVVIFESMVICEYLEETQSGAPMYPQDALSRARQRSWIEFAGSTLSDAWQFLHATDRITAETRQAALRTKLERLETELGAGPYFDGALFGMVDAVFAPIFRYFGMLDPAISRPIFDKLPRTDAWRSALAAQPSVIHAVGADYASRLREYLHQQGSLHIA
ncbi:glutathione S-transferase family protein [Lysobacter gummosus]|uniref:glutathione S-transferase family protein n=1 Tax=Lysobacter gummosus TaxID=262324 RepID=UPI00363D4722